MSRGNPKPSVGFHTMSKEELRQTASFGGRQAALSPKKVKFNSETGRAASLKRKQKGA